MIKNPLVFNSLLLIILGVSGLFLISWISKRNSGASMLGYSPETFRRPAIVLILIGVLLGFLNFLIND